MTRLFQVDSFASDCALGPYWRQVLGKDSLQARQVSARGGSLRLRFAGDRVLIGGTANTVFDITVRD